MDSSPGLWDHCLEYTAVSDLGLRRANNQDSKAVVIAGSQEKWETRGHVFMVADGMGAHAAGELASKLATDIVPLTYHKLADLPPPDALLAAIHDANTQIHTRGQANDDFRGMGTTISILVLLPQGALVAQVGDSRVYRLRDQRLEQLTFDHSLVWELRASGQIAADAIPAYIPKNVITRSLGPNPEVQVDLEGLFPTQVGDIYLLCSDGLSGQVKDDEIGKVLGCMPLSEAVRALVDLANLRGGPDNITVVAVRITAPMAALATESSPPTTKHRKPVSPLVWSLLGILALSAVGFAGIGWMIAAGVCGLGCLGTAIAAVIQRYGGGGQYQFDGRMLGKGPYSVSLCKADATFAAQLAELIEQLKDAATRERWAVDWEHFSGHGRNAAAAVQAGRFDEAVREYCRAISFMMAELKRQRARTRHDGSSAVDLL